MALQTRQHWVRSPFHRETRWDSSIERLSFLHQRLFCSFCPFQGEIASARAWLSEKKSGKMCLWEMCREESGAAGDRCTDRPVDFAACWRNPPLHETGDLDGRLANFLVVVLLFSNIVVNPPVYKRANFYVWARRALHRWVSREQCRKSGRCLLKKFDSEDVGFYQPRKVVSLGGCMVHSEAFPKKLARNDNFEWQQMCAKRVFVTFSCGIFTFAVSE